MDSRRDPYDDRYGAAVDASRAGQVTVTVDAVTITEPRRAGWEAEDEKRALFVALETARSEKPDARATETETARARAEWKAAAYQKHVEQAPKNIRLIEKRDQWVAERDRLRARDTKASDVKGGRL